MSLTPDKAQANQKGNERSISAKKLLSTAIAENRLVFFTAPVVLVFLGLGVGIAIRLPGGDMGSTGGSHWLGLPGYMAMRAIQSLFVAFLALRTVESVAILPHLHLGRSIQVGMAFTTVLYYSIISAIAFVFSYVSLIAIKPHDELQGREWRFCCGYNNDPVAYRNLTLLQMNAGLNMSAPFEGHVFPYYITHAPFTASVTQGSLINGQHWNLNMNEMALLGFESLFPNQLAPRSLGAVLVASTLAGLAMGRGPLYRSPFLGYVVEGRWGIQRVLEYVMYPYNMFYFLLVAQTYYESCGPDDTVSFCIQMLVAVFVPCVVLILFILIFVELPMGAKGILREVFRNNVLAYNFAWGVGSGPLGEVFCRILRLKKKSRKSRGSQAHVLTHVPSLGRATSIQMRGPRSVSYQNAPTLLSPTGGMLTVVPSFSNRGPGAVLIQNAGGQSFVQQMPMVGMVDSAAGSFRRPPVNRTWSAQKIQNAQQSPTGGSPVFGNAALAQVPEDETNSHGQDTAPMVSSLTGPRARPPVRGASSWKGVLTPPAPPGGVAPGFSGPAAPEPPAPTGDLVAEPPSPRSTTGMSPPPPNMGIPEPPPSPGGPEPPSADGARRTSNPGGSGGSKHGLRVAVPAHVDPTALGLPSTQPHSSGAIGPGATQTVYSPGPMTAPVGRRLNAPSMSDPSRGVIGRVPTIRDGGMGREPMILSPTQIATPIVQGPMMLESSITSFVPHYRAAEEHNELDFVQAFIMPWSCLMNYAGSFLYEALAVQVILLSTLENAPSYFRTLGAVLFVSFATFGANALPGTSLTCILLSLQMLGAPPTCGIYGTLLAIDFLLERLKAVVNCAVDLSLHRILGNICIRWGVNPRTGLSQNFTEGGVHVEKEPAAEKEKDKSRRRRSSNAPEGADTKAPPPAASSPVATTPPALSQQGQEEGAAEAGSSKPLPGKVSSVKRLSAQEVESPREITKGQPSYNIPVRQQLKGGPSLKSLYTPEKGDKH